MSPVFKSIRKLRDSRVIVFGGTSGIGFAVVAAALEHGATVFVTSSKKDNEIQPIDHIVFTAGDLLKLVPLSESMAESNLASGVVRFLAPLLIGKLPPRYMSVSNRSSITLTSGSMGRRPEQHWTVLAAYAAANEGMRFGMGIDLAPIRVNVVAPGAVTTPLLERLPASEWERWRRQLLTEELGKAEDVAEVYINSMKDRSATGALIDGRLFS
ncbi:hypothetical protein IFM46972_09039 [Aspergillus udagawae]|uniref:Uncharacterized protein n=1 Tax=Aspergillus udagawae TaxID=91492 RepID=A0A8H3PC52_9EURO|nr:hypothetical protein IFM46972_09039 [Aspergillus udagawae]